MMMTCYFVQFTSPSVDFTNQVIVRNSFIDWTAT